MDSTKWKSVVIPISVYHSLKRMAEIDHRTISGQFTYILEKVAENRPTVKKVIERGSL